MSNVKLSPKSNIMCLIIQSALFIWKKSVDRKFVYSHMLNLKVKIVFIKLINCVLRPEKQPVICHREDD